MTPLTNRLRATGWLLLLTVGAVFSAGYVWELVSR